MPANATSSQQRGTIFATLSFQTDGSWLAMELSQFTEAVATTYLLLMALKDIKQRTYLHREVDPARLRFLLGRTWLLPEDDYRHHHWIGWHDVQDVVTELFRQYSEAGSELQIHRIKMASPGWISFRGIGEPLREVRELIKDIWFRNSQERRVGELRIQMIQSLLSSRIEPPTPKGDGIVDVSAVVLTHCIRLLASLEESGKLVNVAKTLDSDEESDYES